MPPDQARTNWHSRAAWITLILVISLAIANAVLAPAPVPERPDVLTTVVASKAVVAAIRIAIVFGALFLVLSVIALIARRQWLTRVGPVEVSGRVSDLDVETRRFEDEIEEANRVIEGLEQKLRTHINC